MKIRVSIATAGLLGLKKCRMDGKPTTLYFLLPGKCEGSCAYCTHKNGYLSRVKWPEFDMEDVIKRIEKSEAKRICIQSPYGNGYMKMLRDVVERINKKPISVSISAVERKELRMLHEAGVERVGVGLDCATEEIFNKWKRGVPSWKEYMETLKNAKEIFGHATCHLIVGLGENDEDIISIMKNMKKMGIDVALFALFLKNRNNVELPRYRAIQIARHAIYNGNARFIFEKGKLAKMYVENVDGNVFTTSGCPHCNRPFYNERVTKIYNYPHPINENEFKKSLEEAREYAEIVVTSR